MPINCLVNQRVKESKGRRDKERERQRDKGTKRLREEETEGKDKTKKNPLKSMAAAPVL